MRSELGAEVAAALLRPARLRGEPLERVVVEAARRDDHAFLLEGARERGQTRGLDAADVRVVRARDGVAERRAGDERDVGQVRAPGVRVVEEGDLAGREAELHDGGDGVGHRAEVDGDVLGLRNHAPAVVEERGRAVAPLLDVRRERGADEHGAHLLGDRAERRADDLELNWHKVFSHASRPNWDHP